MKLDLTKPMVCVRHGLPVEYLKSYAGFSGVLMHAFLFTFPDGTRFVNTTGESGIDAYIVNKKTKKSRWFNIYTSSNRDDIYKGCDAVGHGYKTKEEADSGSSALRQACILVEWEED